MQLLTLSEMAELLKCSVKTFSKDVKEKRLPYMVIGRRKLFDPEEIRACLRYHYPAPPTVTKKHKVTRGSGKFAKALGL